MEHIKPEDLTRRVEKQTFDPHATKDAINLLTKLQETHKGDIPLEIQRIMYDATRLMNLELDKYLQPEGNTFEISVIGSEDLNKRVQEQSFDVEGTKDAMDLLKGIMKDHKSDIPGAAWRMMYYAEKLMSLELKTKSKIEGSSGKS
ncbi:hypothetical protein K8Q98_00870 [Candidatus Nomurabacteria bacterium]|nr:hypothetical protein [Candidatus Nomurabacteria bacterium]